MSEPTVTMTLTEFKAIESAENALTLSLLDKYKFSFVQTLSGMIFVKTPDQINEQLINELRQAIEDRDSTIKKWRDEDPKSFYRINK